MKNCFVIQPFDGAKFDNKYDDVFAPAIKAAGLEPYGVDRDSDTRVPIQSIERGIESAVACLADITLDNPNVWYELGYAIALKREFVMVCGKERTSPFPFDVQHRTIVQYDSESPSDFQEPSSQFTKRLKASMNRREQMGQIESVGSIEGLEHHEMAALVAIAEDSDSSSSAVATHQIRNNMESAGYNSLATTLGLAKLVELSLVRDGNIEDYNGDYYTGYFLTDIGMKWLLDNKDKLNLRVSDTSHSAPDDDIPF